MSNKIHAGGLAVEKRDGQCAHPDCAMQIDWKQEDKAPPGWAVVVIKRYTKTNLDNTQNQSTFVLCPGHTISFTTRQLDLKTRFRKMVRTVIESPFAGDITRNLGYLRAAMRDCLMRDEAPYASHALYTQEGVLRDEDKEERRLGMEAGFLWGEAAEKITVYTDLGITEGMRQGIVRATERGQVIEHRQLKGHWAK